MNTHIVIPVRNNVAVTKALCEQLRDESFTKCWIYDNGSTDETPDYLSALTYADARFFPVTYPDVGIYDLWNDGFRRATHEGADFVAILNNDLIIRPGTIDVLSKLLQKDPSAWIAYPDYDRSLTDPIVQFDTRYTAGTYRHGGMSGFCFMLRAKTIYWNPLVDTQFKLWYGDDDLAFTVQKAGGRQVRVVGWPIEHIGQVTSNQHPELMADIPDDAAAFKRKWGNR